MRLHCIVWCIFLAIPFDALSDSHKSDYFENGLTHVSETAGRGIVSLPGSITDSACTISMNDKYQIIDLPLVRKNASSVHYVNRYFSIDLEHCILIKDITKTNLMNMRFSLIGEQVGKEDGFFKIDNLNNTGLQITDSEGKAIIPGRTYDVSNLVNLNSYKLIFKARIFFVSNIFESGAGNSTIRLKLEYD